MLARTMYLLQSSTPEKRNTVRILVYGQSISEQDWWLEVRDYLQTKFPYANLIMENRAIGGFASQILKKTVRMDVESFYPDLVIFHVYGSHIDYETIINDIRSHTTAEVAIQTDHYTGESAWSDQMSYTTLPGFAEKYGCELIKVREQWIKYLEDNNLEASQLLSDGTHLNDYGNFLLAELIKPHLNYDPAFNVDSFSMVKYFEVGKDVDFEGDTLTLPFDGNRVELVAPNSGFTNQSWAHVIIDDHKPSDFQGTYYYTRPYDSNHSWPWSLGTWVETEHQKPLLQETWTLEYTSASIPYESVSYDISGSRTGPDGSGNNTENFVSHSKRVLFQGGTVDNGGDWHISRSYSVTGSTIFAGQMVHWNVYSLGVDDWHPGTEQNMSIENAFTIIQGISNNHHVLKIVKAGTAAVALKGIRIYRPMWDRSESYHLSADKHQLDFTKDAGQKDISITSNTVWDIVPRADWFMTDITTTSGTSLVTVTASDNSEGADRDAYLVVRGYGGTLDSIHIAQSGGSPEAIQTNREEVTKIFPNPACENITVQSMLPVDRLVIMNISGRVIKILDKTDNAGTDIRIADLPPGLYFIKIISGSLITTYKFVKTDMMN